MSDLRLRIGHLMVEHIFDLPKFFTKKRTGMRHVQPLMRRRGDSIKPKALSKTDIVV